MCVRSVQPNLLKKLNQNARVLKNEVTFNNFRNPLPRDRPLQNLSPVPAPRQKPLQFLRALNENLSTKGASSYNPYVLPSKKSNPKLNRHQPQQFHHGPFDQLHPVRRLSKRALSKLLHAPKTGPYGKKLLRQGPPARQRPELVKKRLKIRFGHRGVLQHAVLLGDRPQI